MFLDKAKIYVKGGDGGDGLVSFRREKFTPKGGPDGGNGGRGGNVYFKVNPHLTTLSDIVRMKKIIAPSGKPGGKNKMTGKSGDDLVVEVPLGTMIYDDITGELLFDLASENELVCVAKGGRGGRGNAAFLTPQRQRPDFAEKGEAGEEKYLRLELKLIADVGIIGFPNVGKSTLIAKISNTRPKIANYPFTTLKPNLGVVNFKGKSFVVADIPGLIEGAHKGKGLGDEFLRHVERCRILIHLLDATSKNLKEDFLVINKELKLYSKNLAKKEQILVINKIDLIPENERLRIIKEKWELASPQIRKKPLLISAVTGEGIEQLLNKLIEKLEKIPPEAMRQKIIPVLRPQDNLLENFKIEKSGEIFVVKGKIIEKIASTIDVSNPQSLAYFRQIAEKAGLFEKLKRKKIKEGNIVIVGRLKLIWGEF
jgi:GTP-binding protein